MQPVPKCKEFTRPKSDPECRIISVMLQLWTKYHAEYAIDVFVRGPHDRQLVWTTVCRDKAQYAGAKRDFGCRWRGVKANKGTFPSHLQDTRIRSPEHVVGNQSGKANPSSLCYTHNNVEQTLVPRIEHYTEVTSTRWATLHWLAKGKIGQSRRGDGLLTRRLFSGLLALSQVETDVVGCGEKWS